MASSSEISDVVSSKDQLCVYFGDFDREECNRYFKQIGSVQFAKMPSKDAESIAEDILHSDGKEKPICNTNTDGTVLCTDELNEPVQKQSSAVDSNQLGTEKVFFGEAPLEEGGGQKKSANENVSTPKVKPASWAALFKSGSDASVGKVTTVISVNYPDTVKKEAEIKKEVTDQPSKIISVEKDQNALALADFLQKSTVPAANSPLQLRGLINNGNWCYINATLQSLLGCPLFYNLFKAMHSIKQRSDKPSSTPLTDTMTDFANEFSTLDLRGLNNKLKKTDDLSLGTSFEPKKVYDVLSVLKSTLSETGRQQDAEEFLTFLLNGLHEEFQSLSKLAENIGKTNHFVNSNDTTLVNGDSHVSNATDLGEDDVDDDDENNENDECKANDEWEHVGRNNKSANLRKVSSDETFITRLFGGILRSSVHHAGAKESAMLQPFFTIQLDIQAENIWNIKDAFENYFTKESIEGFTSSKTNSKVDASHKTSLEKLPQVLILHLKYFVYDKTGGCQKTHKHVEISRELEIPKDVLSSNLKGRIPANQRSYELFAVEFHLGKHAAGGHYTTAVKHKDPIGWVYCNDSIIQKTQFSQIIKQQKDKVPYLLFYERVGHFGR